MTHHNFKIRFAFFALVIASSVHAEDVLPAIGGGQVGMMDGAPMKHISVAFDGSDIEVHVDETVSTPLLRNLTSPDQFNAAEAWAVLDGKHHNFQYGWVPDGIWAPPAGSAVWVEQISASSGLDTYEGGRFMSEAMIRAMTFDPIFGTNDTADIWKWSGVMTHNAYAVLDPTLSEYSATYRVYLGDENTGLELVSGTGAPLYGSDEVTVTFSSSVPEPSAGLLLAAAAIGFVVTRNRRRAHFEKGCPASSSEIYHDK